MSFKKIINCFRNTICFVKCRIFEGLKVLNFSNYCRTNDAVDSLGADLTGIPLFSHI